MRGAGAGSARCEFVDFGDAAALRAALASHRGPAVDRDTQQPAAAHHRHRRLRGPGPRRRRLTVVDNTFLSPAWQLPLTLGADVVVHSTTKYLNGHSDVVGGAVIARDPALHEQLAWWANCLGLTGAPFDSFLTLRGIRTLHARLEHHGRNAQALAEWLCECEPVQQLWYPGLPAHPRHELAKRQQKGFGAVITLELAGGHEAVREFVAGLECFSLAESLGGVESLVAHPATMTHAAMDPAARARAGLTDGLLRLSVGIEGLADLREDLARALERVSALNAAAAPIRAAAGC